MPGATNKRRPFVIVSGDAFNANDRFRKVMVIHLTTVARAGGPYDWEITLPRGTAGLPAACTAKCAEIYTLWKDHLTALAGTLPREYVTKIDAAIMVALALRP